MLILGILYLSIIDITFLYTVFLRKKSQNLNLWCMQVFSPVIKYNSQIMMAQFFFFFLFDILEWKLHEFSFYLQDQWRKALPHLRIFHLLISKRKSLFLLFLLFFLETEARAVWFFKYGLKGWLHYQFKISRHF